MSSANLSHCLIGLTRLRSQPKHSLLKQRLQQPIWRQRLTSSTVTSRQGSTSSAVTSQTPGVNSRRRSQTPWYEETTYNIASLTERPPDATPVDAGALPHMSALLTNSSTLTTICPASTSRSEPGKGRQQRSSSSRWST
ncbi:hypothetical protein AAT19DRAFT_14848 [Rhodotorula toruloides]|uniref:Uncharacterized protein n=1 Tax=Rhodotorula toruloides TaxID=5286 RepID=A0A2T0A8Y9_RHOTO|nr:hypothetical protein AAT19DRAFT_14848 [Rhodotorula toruloides]